MQPRSEPPSGKLRSSEQRVRAEAHPALSGAAVWMVGSPMNPARSCREMAVLHGVAGGLGLDARSNVCGVCGGAFALTTANTGRTVSVRARNPNHSAWAGAPPHSDHHSASPAVLRSTHTSELFYLTAGSCDPARQEHFSSALETFVRRWRPATFDYVVHTGRRRVSSGLAGPHPDSTDSRGRSTSQPERMLTQCQPVKS